MRPPREQTTIPEEGVVAFFEKKVTIGVLYRESGTGSY